MSTRKAIGDREIQYGKYKGKQMRKVLNDFKYMTWVKNNASKVMPKDPYLYNFVIKNYELEDSSSDDDESSDDEKEFVYFIKSGNEDVNGKMAVKIGRTENDVEKRRRQLQTGNPEELVTIKIILVKQRDDVESLLHKFFEDNIIRGEWYRLSYDDIENAIKTIEHVCPMEF